MSIVLFRLVNEPYPELQKTLRYKLYYIRNMTTCVLISFLTSKETSIPMPPRNFQAGDNSPIWGHFQVTLWWREEEHWNSVFAVPICFHFANSNCKFAISEHFIGGECVSCLIPPDYSLHVTVTVHTFLSFSNLSANKAFHIHLQRRVTSSWSMSPHKVFG